MHVHNDTHAKQAQISFLKVCVCTYSLLSLCDDDIMYCDREMVKAMQDPGAGIKLNEFGPKRGKTVTKYFTGILSQSTGVFGDGHGLGSMAIHFAHHCFSFNMRCI